MNSSPVRVRFAPSPTGFLHLGGARTALVNWLYARHTGGTFVLRIEDTDRARSTAEMTDGILDGLRWLGLNWHEGPYHQADGASRHQSDTEKLIQGGHAYRCFCPPDQSRDQVRDVSQRRSLGLEHVHCAQQGPDRDQYPPM